MTRSEEFEAINDTLATTGWKLILEDIDNIVKNVDTIDNCTDLLELGRRQGRLEQIRFFLNLRDWYESAQTIHEAQDASNV